MYIQWIRVETFSMCKKMENKYFHFIREYLELVVNKMDLYKNLICINLNSNWN